MSELLIERSLPDMQPTGDGWTVHGLAVPYNRVQRVSDDRGRTYYGEAFVPHAFSRDCEKGGRWVNLMLGHAGDDGDRFLGRAVEMSETEDGLYLAFRLDRSHPNAEAARSGELTGWSVSARVYRSRREVVNGEPRVYRELCGLSHVAATAQPQYVGAGVLVAREHEVVTVGSRTPRLDALRDAGFGRK